MKFKKQTPSGKSALSIFTSAVVTLAASLFLSSAASAQELNGNYSYVSAVGTLTVAGKTVSVSELDAKPFVTNSAGFIVVQGSQLKINTPKVGILAKKTLAKLKVISNLSVTSSGPGSIPLKFVERSYVGTITTPIAINFTGKYLTKDVTGRLKSFPNVKVKAGAMTIRVPISGKLITGPGQSTPATGFITITGQKVP